MTWSGPLTTVVLATRNPGKIGELRRGLGSSSMRWTLLPQPPDLRPPVEHGRTLEENAVHKALQVARATRSLALADDSGLEVTVLGGVPGVHSARYAGALADDTRNVRKLLRALARVPSTKRHARFRCVLCLAGPSGVLAMAQGSVEGVIAGRPSGHQGFGYDPVFMPAGSHGRTFADMTAAEKQHVSHRGRAVSALRRIITQCARPRS